MSASRHVAALPDPGSVAELKVDSIRFGVLFALSLTIVQRIIGLIRGVVFCRVLPEDQLGQWSLTWSYMMLLAPLAVFGLPGCFNRYVEMYRQRGQLGSFLWRITLASLVTTLLFSAALILFASPVAVWLYRDAAQRGLVIVLGATLITVVAFNYLTSLMEALRQVRLVSGMRFVNGVLFAVVSTALALFWSATSEALVWGFVIACVAGCLPAYWYLRQNRRQLLATTSRTDGPRESIWSRIGPFAAWMWGANLLSNLYETLDRTMLLHLSPVDTVTAQALVGQYHSGRVIPLVLVGLAAMLGGILMPYLTAHWERGDRDAVRRQLRWTLKLIAIGFTAAGVLILALAPLLFDVILQGKYSDGKSVLPLTLVYCIWYGLLTVAQDWLWCREKGKWACLVVGFGLVANAALNVVLIPHFDLLGAVWATTLSNFLTLAGLFAMNAAFGWKPDRGICLSALFPLVLLLPCLQASAVLIGLSALAVRTSLIFDEREREEIASQVAEILHRLGWRNRAE